MMICPVRGCDCFLELGPRGARCERGHCFDRARSGYVNLLQPQDRRSSHPGDSRAAVQARQRALDGGLASVLRRVLLQAVGDCLRKMAGDERPGPLPSVLDVGCGCGYFLDAVCREYGLEGWGVDLSVPAVEAAARRYPDRRWLVVNADRRLPFADRSFDLLLTVTSRKNPEEFHRVLRPGGRLIAVVSAEDDLAELRERVLGQALATDRTAGTVALFRGRFELENEYLARDLLYLERPALADLLASSYRGARYRAQEKLACVEAMEVTVSHRLLSFRLTDKETGLYPR
ncbi:MAG: methyltransferase domain-containing protein [Desulfuromonadaceae bacterium]|nr:methyltransferase domain-containing protein [Desulfuromonadaceae bacterium]